MANWFYWQQDNLIVNIYLKPAAKINQLMGIHDHYLKISLKAAPIDGKANDALIAFLAELFDTPKSAIRILKGLTNKKKQVSIYKPKNVGVLSEGGISNAK